MNKEVYFGVTTPSKAEVGQTVGWYATVLLRPEERFAEERTGWNFI